ncbi:MAG: thioredoxin [Pseudomonadota bacterium]
MFSFGGKKPAAAGGDIIDVTEADFMTEVIEESRTRPVLVDFWAPWCGPCKTLTPALEAEVTAAGGKVRLAKIDVDQNQMLAGQLRIQSIPTVYAFVDGQPVDAFQGAVPASQIKQFIERLVKMAPGAEAAGAALDEILDAGEAALKQGALAEASQAFGAVLQADPTELRALGGLARAYAASGDMDRARQVLDSAPPEAAADPAIVAARTAVALAEETSGAAARIAQNRAAVERDENDHAARYDLALGLLALGDREAAVDQLLDIFRRDRTWNDEAAKTQLMKLFDAFGPSDPLTLSGRRKLSSMIFA